jgi:hypothetical protein
MYPGVVYVSLTGSDVNECIGDSYEDVSENLLSSVVCGVVRCNFIPSTSCVYIIKRTKYFKIIPRRGNEGGYSYSMKLFLRRGRLQPKGFSWNLVFEDFSKNISRKFKFHLNITRITDTLLEDQYRFFFIFSPSSSYSEKCFRRKLKIKSKHTFY